MKILAITLTALLGFYPFSTSHAQNSDPIKPNVIIIFTDDQGYGDLASYGNAELNTPHTDRMAEEGRVQLLYDQLVADGQRLDVDLDEYPPLSPDEEPPVKRSRLPGEPVIEGGCMVTMEE